MNSNITLLTIFVIIFIILMTVLIFYYFNTKETFQSDPKSLATEYKIVDENNIKISEINDINSYYLIPNPINMNDNLMMLNFSSDSSALTLLRKKENLEKDFTIGFYIAHKNLTDYEYSRGKTKQLLRGIDKDNNEVLNIQVKPNKINGDGEVVSDNPNLLEVTYEGNEISTGIPFSDNILVTDNDGKSGDGGVTYIIITFKNGTSGDFIPKATINVNSKIYTINMANKQAQTLSMKKFIFGSKSDVPFGSETDTSTDAQVDSFDKLLGSVALWNRILDKTELCNNFNCNLRCFEPDKFKCVDSRNTTKETCENNNNCVFDETNDECLPKQDYGGNVNGCIKDCMTTCDDINKCQKICVNCDVEGEFWSEEVKLKKCPWLKETKILDMTVPEAPVIRGFPGDGSILIEWKKPFNGRSEITNYIVMYYEAFSKQTGVQLSISGKSKNDINEYEIKNLKNKTHYDVIVRAVNSRGIGQPSNIITVSPNGNIIASANRNIFSELEEELDKEVGNAYMDFKCDLIDYESVGHTLDYYNHEDRDIENYIQKLNK
tara:strand:- start:3491 stop:5137 length:1647 start_codon:yes stop_codon:yes gene_type:complete